MNIYEKGIWAGWITEKRWYQELRSLSLLLLSGKKAQIIRVVSGAVDSGKHYPQMHRCVGDIEFVVVVEGALKCLLRNPILQCRTSIVYKEQTDARKWRRRVLTAVLLVWIVSAVILAVTPPVVRDAVVILTAEFMRSAGLFIFFIRSKQTQRWKWLQRAWILMALPYFLRVIIVSSGFPKASLTQSSKHSAHSRG